MNNHIENYLKKHIKKAKQTDLKNQKLRNEFIKKFPIESIAKMKKDDYVSGKEDKLSFCNFLETKLRPDGSIKGSPADSKFGFYYNKKKNKYIWLEKRWGMDEDTAFNSIVNEIADLLDLGKSKDFKAISEIKLSPMFKNKILYTYYPNDYLNVFSEIHIEHFIKKLNSSYDKKTLIEIKRDQLLQYKNSNPLMSNWTNGIFSDFLYKSFDPKNIEQIIATEQQLEELLHGADISACYIERVKLVKERKVSQANLNELKIIYKGKCQLCGMDTVAEHGIDILEGHHIEYFCKSQNNNKENLLLICPNCHRVIHKLNPYFNKETLSYEFENDKTIRLKINSHLSLALINVETHLE